MSRTPAAIRWAALVAVTALWPGCGSGPPLEVPRTGFYLPREARVVDLTREFQAQGADWIAGTFASAPAETVSGGSRLDELSPGRLIGPLAVIDTRRAGLSDPTGEVTVEDLASWEDDHGPFPSGGVAVLLVGPGPEHQGFSPAAAEFLLRECGLRGLGTSADSLEPSAVAEPLVERTVHAGGGIALFGLDRLDRLPPLGSVIIAAPPRIPEGRAPARVLAVVPR